MKISDILAAKGTDVASIRDVCTIHEAITALVKHNIGSLLVYDAAGEVVGIITERDILRESAVRAELLKQRQVRDIMTRELLVGLPDDDIEYIMGVMTRNRVRHLPVMSDGKVLGIVSIGDVVKAQLENAEFENHYLKDYMQVR